tara:strand:- start:297 stop:1052 length:756 start_codon:yes stop_codon:yes gene_type:complete
LTWFDILKLGGEDFGVPPEKDAESYDDAIREKKDFFHNLRNVATTRPHFEYSAKKKFQGDKIEGNLKGIAQAIGNKGAVGRLHIAFSDPFNSDYVVSFRRLKPEDTYTSSMRPSKFNRPAKPKDLGNTDSVILFDSVYSTSDVARLKRVFSSPFQALLPIWGEDDKRRLREVMAEKSQTNVADALEESRKLNRELEKLYKKNKNRKITPQQKEKNFNRIDEIKNRLKRLGRLTQRGKGRRDRPTNIFGGSQ